MTLIKHIDAEQLEGKLLQKVEKTPLNNREQYIFKYNSNKSVPRYEIPEDSSAGELVYEYLSEELALDGNPTLNLASFVNTSLNDTQLKLISDNIVKNLADYDEYPSLAELQTRCVSILSNLWHAPTTIKNGKRVTNSIGTATTGSSEAIMLGGLALKKRWQEKMRTLGKPTDNPNILMASSVQVALEKFARYFDVENRIIHINEESGHAIDITKIKEYIDENTIGIFVVLGTTFTGAFEPVETVSKILDEVEQERGIDVRIHVDAASGGFVAPFVYPHLRWDFEVSRVDSINTSGHKFGLTTAGLGWIIWKDQSLLPSSLKFKLDYLGGIEETFSLNFSRPGFPVIHQYYNFITLGREGYTKIFDSCISNARILSQFLEESGYFEVLSCIHRKVKNKKNLYSRHHYSDFKHSKRAVFNEDYCPGLPIVSFRFSRELRNNYPEIPQSVFALLLRNIGYIIPNYHLTADENDKEILRIVVRESLSLNLMEKLMHDIISSIELLLKSSEKVKEMFKSKGQAIEEDKAVIYGLLLSIASNGVEDIKKAQHEAFGLPTVGDHKHKKSYRGPC